MNEWKAKQLQKQSTPGQSKFANARSDPLPKPQAAAPPVVSDSYTSDDFEETYTSVSGSGSSKLPTVQQLK
jgi:hypothetical protein